MADSRTVRLRILVREATPGPEGRFGLQDRDGALAAGEADGDGLRFEFEATAREAGGEARLSGPWTHGPAGDRFAYVSWRDESGGWSHRLKIPLTGIAWSDVEAASEGGALEAEVRNAGRPRAEVVRAWAAASD